MRMRIAARRSVGLGAALLVVMAGCADLAPLQARLDDLQSRVERLEAESAKSAAGTAAAQGASAKADQTATQAMRAAKANANAIAALEEKIDRMFKRPPANSGAPTT
jgi:hypothetical protein